MSRVILLNGTPGTGKSTVADLWQQADPSRNRIEVDVFKHINPLWPADPQAAGLHARKLAVIAVTECLDQNLDVIVPQYLAKPAFADELAAVAASKGGESVEVLLELPADEVAARLAQRRDNPDRPEQVENDKGVTPEEAPALVAGLQTWKQERPGVICIDASGTPEAVLARLEEAIGR